MKVEYLSLKEQFKDICDTPSFRKIFEDCNFIHGREVEEFESRFASLCEVKYAVALNSGTDAIFLALKVLNIGPGDEVITVSNSFIATAGAIVSVGARPVFVDVGDDYNMDPSLIEPAINERTKAILPVHLTGNPAKMDQIGEIARKYNLAVIEDAAQAVGARYKGKRVGSFGLGCFSLHPLKNLNVCGDGGVITTDSEEFYQGLRLLRNHGLIDRNESLLFGYNSRLDTLQAAIALSGLEKLNKTTEKRIDNAHFYDQHLSKLSEFVRIPPRCKDVKQVFHTYVIQVKDRDNLASYLENNGVETKVHYPIPIHLQPASRFLGFAKGDLPVSEQQSERILSLPIHQYLTPEQLQSVIECLSKFYSV